MSNTHVEIIKCPECDTIQQAEVEHTTAWNIYIHHCKNCNYTITESDWDKIELEEE
jgi:phage FluMu protein Com